MGGVNKTERISLNVSPSQKERWQTEADKRERSLPDFIRHAVETYIVLMEKVENRSNLT